MSEHPTSPGSPGGGFVRLLDLLVGSPRRLVLGLAVVCLLLAAGDLLYHKHATVAVEALPLFYPVFGFVIYGLIVFAAKALRLVIRRPEGYYGPYATDAETPNRHMTGSDR